MATVTAQILVGHPGTFHAGIRPTHGVCAFENSRPYRVLAPLGLHLEEGSAGRACTWLPAPDHLLEEYPMDLEVCTSAFAREVDGWRGEVVRPGAP